MDTLPVSLPEPSAVEVRLSVVEKAVGELKHDHDLLSTRLDAELGKEIHAAEKSLLSKMDEHMKESRQLVSGMAQKFDEKIGALSDNVARAKSDLNEKINQTRVALDEKISQVRIGLDEKISQVHIGLDEKISQTRIGLEEKIAQTRLGLEEKIEQTRIGLEAKIVALDAKVDQTRVGLEAKMDQLKSDFDKRLEFYGRVYLATTVPIVLCLAAMVTTLTGRMMQWW